MQGEGIQGEGAHSYLYSGEHKLTPELICMQVSLIPYAGAVKERLCDSPVDSPEELSFLFQTST